MLGFARNSAAKAVDSLLKEDRKLPVEEIVRRALKLL
jgi:Holliday junction resolvasome RuvABC DNA-binding subunit